MARPHRRWVSVLVLVVLLAGCPSSVPQPGPSTPQASDQPSVTRATPGTPAATPHPATEPAITVTVIEVTDGDTLRIRYRNGTHDTVRLLGVDTPEVHAENTPGEFEGVPDTDAGAACLGRWGDRASAFARERLAGQTVRLGFDPNAGRRGYYGRLLAYVYVDGRQFNYALLARGYARLYDGEFLAARRYANAEDRAQAANRGLWSCTRDATGTVGTTTTTATNTATSTAQSGVRIVAIHADADGNDNENLNDEYIVLENTGDTTLDLGGWTVSDAAGHRYQFPSDAALAPGETLTLYTGTGENTATNYYWGQDGAVWNNGGDTVVVRDADGNRMTSKSYG